MLELQGTVDKGSPGGVDLLFIITQMMTVGNKKILKLHKSKNN